jgi:hypothetical protein
MVLRSCSEPLSQLEVLAVDCQAMAAAPRGHLLEIGRVRVSNTVTPPHACLIVLLDGEHIPPAVTRITVALRLGAGPALDESRLASALWWV